MALGGTYNTGTVNVTAGSATAAGTGVLWSDVVEGDWLAVGTTVGVIDSVNAGYDTITLKDAWAGSANPVVTISIASPAVVSRTAHGYVAGQEIRLATTGALPTGLTAGTTYYVIAAGLTADAFELSATAGGTAINTSGTQSGTHSVGNYRILKMSWLRYDPSLTQERLRTFIQDIEAAGLFLFVTGAAPDASLGEDGQYALKTNVSGSPWLLWYKVSGAWVAQGSPVGINWQGTWDSGTTYVVNDVVLRLGSAYISLIADNLNDPPESSPASWDLYVAGGYRYDFLVWDNGRPTSGEVLIRAPMATAVTIPAGFTDSVAIAETASAGTAVYSIQKEAVEFGTLTFSAGNATGAYASASGASFSVGEILTVVAPNPRDDTLSGVAATIVGYR